MDPNIFYGRKIIKPENIIRVQEGPPPTRLEKIEYAVREAFSWWPLVVIYAGAFILMALLNSVGPHGGRNTNQSFLTGFMAGHTAVMMMRR